MPLGRNRFTNPANGDIYDWAINHKSEDAAGRSRAISHDAPTENRGLIRQVGAESPFVFTWQGTILARAQLIEMIGWYRLCRTQTIYLTDFAGDQYEVVISGFVPTRRRVLRNGRDFANAPYNVWDYSITIEVIAVRAGVWAGIDL